MIILIRFYTLSLIPLFPIFTMNPLYDYNTYDFFFIKVFNLYPVIYECISIYFSGMLFLWLYQSNKFMVISYNNAKTIQVNTIAHKIVPACVVVAICLGTLIWQEVRHLTHSIRSSEFTRLYFKATHLVLLLLLH